MVKFSQYQKLPREEREELLIELCEALVSVKNSQEAAQLLTDLLSSQEAEMIAKRLKIAHFLILGKTYEDIKKNLKVSDNTISRVNSWLNLSGEGYRLVISRRKKQREEDHDGEGRDYSWRYVKRKYPTYFWPQLVLEEIVKNANKKQKERLISTLSQLDKKSRLYKDLKKVLYMK